VYRLNLTPAHVFLYWIDWILPIRGPSSLLRLSGTISRNSNHAGQCNCQLQSLGTRRGGRKVALRLMSPPLLPLQPLPLHACPPLPPLKVCWTVQLPTTITGFTVRRSRNCTETWRVTVSSILDPVPDPHTHTVLAHTLLDPHVWENQSLFLFHWE
jgi:hypothetical protein